MPVSAYATTVPGRMANPGPSAPSNRAGAGMTPWFTDEESFRAVEQAERGR